MVNLTTLQDAAVADGNGVVLETDTDEVVLHLSGTRVAKIIVEGSIDGEDWNAVHDVYDEEPLFIHLTVDGDGTGVSTATGDYSGAGDEEFWYGPPDGFDAFIAWLVVAIEDNAIFDSGYYGGTNAALTEGILVEKQDSAGVTVVDLLAGEPIKTNADWKKNTQTLSVEDFGSGNSVLVAGWSLSETGFPMILHGDLGDKLVVTCRDVMTGLVDQHFLLQGLIREVGVVHPHWHLAKVDTSSYAMIRARVKDYSSGSVTVRALKRPAR